MSKKSFRESATQASKMELVREMPDISTTEWNQQFQHQQDGQSFRQDLATQKIIIEALTTLLIEKEFFYPRRTGQAHRTKETGPLDAQEPESPQNKKKKN